MADEEAMGARPGGALNPSNWTVDVQRGLAWTIILLFAALTMLLAIRVVVSGLPTDALELLKQVVNALINIAMMVMGFLYGAAKGTQAKDDAQAKIIEKLTSPPPNGPVAPVPSPPIPTVVVAWWSLLTDAEKAAMTEAAKTDARIQALIAVFAAGKAESEHLEALVTAGLLTKQRAETLKTA